MSTLQALRLKRFAEADAEAGVYQPEERVKSLIGEREPWDTEKYPHQGLLADDLRREPLAEEFQPAAFGESSDGSAQAPTVVLLSGAILFLGVGAVAMMQLVGIQGWPPLETLVLGSALECFLVALTGGVRNSFTGERKSIWAPVGLVIIYFSFLASTAVLRISDVAVPGGQPTVFDWAACILLVCVTAGPAWLAEGCLRALRNSAPKRTTRKHASTQLRINQRRVQDAKKQFHLRGVRQQAWDQDSAQLTAIYDAAFRQRAASLGNHTITTKAAPEAQFPIGGMN